jgi:GT2 family glycosyltransferase
VSSAVESLLSQTAPADHVIVVDNGSRDGSVVEIRRSFPDVEVFETRVNLGYGGGMNAGIARLLGRGVDAILLLTHECRLDRDALRTLAERLEEEADVGAVGPLLGFIGEPGRVFSAGGRIERQTWRPRHQNKPTRVAAWVGRPPHSVEWLDGAAILLRSTAVREAGAIDEEYFLYFEEAEYLLRLQALGWRVECVPAAMAWQQPGTKPTYLWVRNRLRFLARTAPKRHVVRETGRLAASVFRNGFVPNKKLSRTERRDRKRALRDFLLRRWGADPESLNDVAPTT